MRKKSSIALIISIVVCVLLVVGGITIFSRLDKVETTKTVGTFMTYEVGKLDSTTGKGMGKSAIEECDDYQSYMHLRTYINPDGLKVKVNDNATVQYKIYFYDEHYALVSSTNWLDSDFKIADYQDYDSTFKYALVEVTPTSDPDGVISGTEITKYAGMLTISYNKFDEN